MRLFVVFFLWFLVVISCSNDDSKKGESSKPDSDQIGNLDSDTKPDADSFLPDSGSQNDDYISPDSDSAGNPDNSYSDNDSIESDIDNSDIDISDDSDKIIYSCTNILKLPVTLNHIAGFTNSEDFDFFDKYIVSASGEDIVKQTIDAKTKPFSPGIGGMAGMRYLPDGSIAVAVVSQNALVRVYPNGGSEVMLGNIQYPNGVEVDENGWVYVSEHNTGKIIQVKPETKEHKYIAEGMFNTNGLSFSPDYKTLYCGSFGAGIIYKIKRLENNEWAKAEVFGRTPNGPSWGCDSFLEGDGCTTEMGVPGVCEKNNDKLECNPIDLDVAACKDLSEGAFCFNYYTTGGICTFNEVNVLECNSSISLNGCDDKKEGYSCLSDENQEGKCEKDGENLICKAPPLCKNEGELCFDNIAGLQGLCMPDNGKLICNKSVDLYGCDGKNEGYSCYADDNSLGICTDNSGILECVTKDNSVEACSGLAEKRGCYDFDGEGICLYPDGSDILSCDNNYKLMGCEGKEADFFCTDLNYNPGTCKDKNGTLECEIKDTSVEACSYNYEGYACNDTEGEGICVYPEGGSVLYCDNSLTIAGCDGKKENFICYDEAGNYGFCLNIDGKLKCSQPSEGCEDKEEGDVCLSEGYQGICKKDGEELVCEVQNSASGGGLDGLNVDACGYVYVTEYVLGKIWRFTPDGSKVELFAETGVQWIPNLHWGNGIGGWGETTLYIMERNNGWVFYIDTLVPGKEYLRPDKR